MSKYKVLAATVPLTNGTRAYPGNIVDKNDIDADVFEAFEKKLEKVEESKIDSFANSENSLNNNSVKNKKGKNKG